MAKKTKDRAFEDKLGIGALIIASKQPQGIASTTLLKDRMPKVVELSEADMAPSKTRKGEPMYRQIVGNIVCHRHDMPGNIIYEGYAEYLGPRKGIRITDAGYARLKKMGY